MNRAKLTGDPVIIVAAAIREGLLVPVLEDWQETGRFPLWALYQAGRQRVPRIRASSTS
jgi:DNA-binding transcriptional LysR family regulator